MTLWIRANEMFSDFYLLGTIHGYTVQVGCVRSVKTTFMHIPRRHRLDRHFLVFHRRHPFLHHLLALAFHALL